MKVATYVLTAAGEAATAEEVLAGLAAHAKGRGWDVALEIATQGPWPESRSEGRLRLLQAVRGREVQAVLVRSLSHLARSLRHLTDLGDLLARHDVALVALDDHFDTTDPGGAIRWRGWLDISLRVDRQLRSEAARLAQQQAPETQWGRSRLAVSPSELLAWWEGRRRRRPRSVREIAHKLGISQGIVRHRLRELRAAGKVDDTARARAIAARGGPDRGGRPASPIDDTALAAEWRTQQRIARRRGTAPSLSAIARNLHISRSRALSRLRALGLLGEDGSPQVAVQGAKLR